MAFFRRRASIGLGMFISLLLPSLGSAEEAQGPRYTYVGAGYQWTDAKCGIKPGDEQIEGYYVEGSVGVLPFLHVLGDYSDGDADFSDSGTSKERDFQCYRIGLGTRYGLTDRVDLVGRAYYVDAEIDAPRRNITLDDDGYEIEALVRIMASEKAEVHVGYAYTDLSDDDDRQVRLGLVYNVTPMVAVRFGGTGFDNDTGFDAGVRVYFGDNLF